MIEHSKRPPGGEDYVGRKYLIVAIVPIFVFFPMAVVTLVPKAFGILVDWFGFHSIDLMESIHRAPVVGFAAWLGWRRFAGRSVGHRTFAWMSVFLPTCIAYTTIADSVARLSRDTSWFQSPDPPLPLYEYLLGDICIDVFRLIVLVGGFAICSRALNFAIEGKGETFQRDPPVISLRELLVATCGIAVLFAILGWVRELPGSYFRTFEFDFLTGESRWHFAGTGCEDQANSLVTVVAMSTLAWSIPKRSLVRAFAFTIAFSLVVAWTVLRAQLSPISFGRPPGHVLIAQASVVVGMGYSFLAAFHWVGLDVQARRRRRDHRSGLETENAETD